MDILTTICRQATTNPNIRNMCHIFFPAFLVVTYCSSSSCNDDIRKQRRFLKSSVSSSRTWRFIFNAPSAASGRSGGDKWRRLRDEGDFVLEVSEKTNVRNFEPMARLTSLEKYYFKSALKNLFW